MAKKPEQHLLEWLVANGPDEWHRVACSWNWDAGYGILNWVVDQNACDRGTALQLFWLGEPAFYLKYRDRDDILRNARHSVDGYDFVMKVLSNWKAGRYVTSRFATNGVERMAVWFAREEQKVP